MFLEDSAYSAQRRVQWRQAHHKVLEKAAGLTSRRPSRLFNSLLLRSQTVRRQDASPSASGMRILIMLPIMFIHVLATINGSRSPSRMTSSGGGLPPSLAVLP